MGCSKAASVRPYLAVKSSFTKEVSPWLSLSVKCPRLVVISVVVPTGSSLLPASRFAPSAVNPSCPTELARLAVPTMAVRSWPLRLSKAKAENAEEGFRNLPLFPCLMVFFHGAPLGCRGTRQIFKWVQDPHFNYRRHYVNSANQR